MKNIFKYLASLLAVVLFAAAFTACESIDENGAQDAALSIKVFFPTKVVAGQPMTINGSGLGSVTEIEFPGGVRATGFKIVSDDMIRVTAPAGIASEGGKIKVRAGGEEAESPLPLTLGKTVVTGFSKQPGETAQGGELITVYGSDLEFINGVELLDSDGNAQIIDQKDFYRKGTSSLIFYVPKYNIFEGTFVGTLHTYDGLAFSMPELAYEPAAQGGHYETEKTTIWKNDGSHGEISWSGEYRFAPESNSTGEEIYTVPQDIWDNYIKGGTFYLTFTGSDWIDIRVTTGWWSTTWTGNDITSNEINAGDERVTANEDGTYTLEINFSGDPILDVIDAQHLLFTGGGYTPVEIYFTEEVWVDGGEGYDELVTIWKNDGSHGQISWSGEYRFAPESNSTGEEIYTVPQDIWDEVIKGGTFYLTFTGSDWIDIRVTTGWWSTTWTGNDITSNEISAGDERVTDNGDGTYTLEINFSGDPILDVLDAQHLLFTGGGYTPVEVYYVIHHSGSGPNPVDIWKNDGSLGQVSWSGDYRFAPESNSTGEECYTVPQDVWDNHIKSGKFYLTFTGSDWIDIRVTTGWWSTTWTGNDITSTEINAGDERVTDNGDGTYTLEINFSGDPILDVLDAQHLLFTGGGYTPMKLFYME